MTVYLRDPDFVLYQGEALEILRGLESGSVDAIVTSPPYWGLRDYGTGRWQGGDPACDHSRPPTTYNRGFNERWGQGAGARKQERKHDGQYRARCRKCGAARVDLQLGLEKTSDGYVAALVAIFAEAHRVLAETGTLWLNLGDSYSAGAGPKPKDLGGIPWRAALALQADGWWLRSDVIWSKRNAMPESVPDRPTKAHEYLFLLTKAARYYYDGDEIREDFQTDPSENYPKRARIVGRGKQSYPGYQQNSSGGFPPNGSGRNARSVWEIATQPYPDAHFATFPEELARRCVLAGCPEGGVVLDPFLGSGTTAVVARRFARRCVGIELNPDYCALAARRLQQQSLLAETVT